MKAVSIKEGGGPSPDVLSTADPSPADESASGAAGAAAEAPVKMRTMSIALLQKKVTNKKLRTEDIEGWLMRITHLHVEGCKLQRLGDLVSRLVNLKVLYAYDNDLQVLDILPPKVEAVYLQNNAQLQRVEAITLCSHLKILNVSHSSLEHLQL